MNWRRWLRPVKFILLILIVILLLAPEWPAFADERYRLQEIVGLREFDFLVWESNAFLGKGESTLAAGHRYLDEAEQKGVVLEYLQLMQDTRQLEHQIQIIYTDPEIEDRDLFSQELQSQLAETREALEKRQLLAEAIVQHQVGQILIDEEFELLGQAWPPVLMHVTSLPSVLIVSPRERIEKEYQVNLVTGLATPDKEEIESAVFDDLNLSALVVPIGGVGTYPSMIMETSDINRLAEVTSHEWTHHWLTLQPLGFNYAFDPAVRIINETVASIVDQELGQKVVERYYPEYLPPDGPDEIPSPFPADLSAFDFGAEMAITRIKADELLAEGKIEEAEAYMEERRQEFLNQGYAIRKLNQAYFAFYGAYAAEPEGAQGGNPIGPMLRDIREKTPSVRAFLDTVAPITSFAELQELHSQMMVGSEMSG
jgi:hypothetical protein